jgi:pyruvate dehydrogenase E2 component (dihydrolipoamide acetyltransferase)
VAAEAVKGPPPLPAGLMSHLEPAGALTPFERAVAANLRRSTSQLILTSIDADCRIAPAQARIQAALAKGRMVSLLHMLIAAAAKALPRFPRLMSLVHDNAIYRYRAVDVAFVVRAADGRLFTPVVRAADQADVDSIAKACQAVTLRVLRGAAKVEELEGACFTISQVAVEGTARVVALPSFGQSAVLGVSAERSTLVMAGDSVERQPFVTLTLTYDHAICDGAYAAMFLNALVAGVQA